MENTSIEIYNGEITSDITLYDQAILTLFNYLELPTENILVLVDERKKVFKNIEDVVSLLPPDVKCKSVYISKFLSAVGAGLFDAALNYLWDETVYQLRERISQYDIQYFFDIVASGERRQKLDSEEDLVKIDDSELIQGAKEIGLISDIGYKLLDNIKYMRNWASAAHPNQVALTGLQLISWLETCIKEVVSLPQSTVTIQIRKLLQNIKNDALTEAQAETICNTFSELPIDKADSLCNGFFGIYSRKDTSLETKQNIKMLLPKLWDVVSEEVKWNIGIKFGKFTLNNEQKEAQNARAFLQIVNGESYLPENIRATELKMALDELNTAHYAFSNNFYLEPPCAKRIKELVGGNDIPKSVNPHYVLTITNAYLTNGNGKAWGAEDIYKELISRFDQNQMFVAIASFIKDNISSKLQFPLCISQYKSLLDIAKNSTTSPRMIELINELSNYKGKYADLRSDDKIMYKVNTLKNILKS